jgi:hypothetical protein
VTSFTDATGAPGIMTCIPAAIHELKVSAPSYCAGSSVTFALSNTTAGRTYQLYKGDDKVMNTLTTANSGAATFSGTFAGAGVYTAKAEPDAVHCAAVMIGAHTISEIPLPTIAYLSGSTSQTVIQGNTITDIKYVTANATSATSSSLPAGVDGTWSANTFTIAGTPTASGTFSYTVTPTHTNGCTASTTAAGAIVVNAAYPPGAGTVTYTAGGLVWSSPVKYDDPTCTKVTAITSNTSKQYAVASGNYYYTAGCARNSPYLCPSPWRLPLCAEVDNARTLLAGHMVYGCYGNSRGFTSDQFAVTKDASARGDYELYDRACGKDNIAYAFGVQCVRPQ